MYVSWYVCLQICICIYLKMQHVCIERNTVQYSTVHMHRTNNIYIYIKPCNNIEQLPSLLWHQTCQLSRIQNPLALFKLCRKVPSPSTNTGGTLPLLSKASINTMSYLNNQQKFQVPKMEVLNLIRLYWRWGFPYIALTYSLCRWVPPF